MSMFNLANPQIKTVNERIQMTHADGRFDSGIEVAAFVSASGATVTVTGNADDNGITAGYIRIREDGKETSVCKVTAASDSSSNSNLTIEDADQLLETYTGAAVVDFTAEASYAKPILLWTTVEQRFNNTIFVLTIRNRGDVPLSLKFQDSDGSPADDNKVTIGIDSDTFPSNAVKWVYANGMLGFYDSFRDIDNAEVTDLQPGGEKTLTFSSTKTWLRVVAPSAEAANNAVAWINGKTNNTVVQYENFNVRRTKAGLA